MKVEPRPEERHVALGLAVVAWRAGLRVGTVALRPVRVLGDRAPVRRRMNDLAATGQAAEVTARRKLEDAAEGVLAAPEAERTIDHMLSGPLPESLARSIGQHRVVERVARETVESTDFDDALTKALANERTDQIVARVLASEEFESALRRVLSSPAIRQALEQQAAGFGAELAGGLRHRARRLDDALERPPRRWFSRSARAGEVPYGGLASRAVAGIADVGILALIFVVGGALVGLFSAIFGGTLHPHWLVAAIAGVSGLLLDIAYFVGFWSVVGQTPGMRLLRLRLSASDGGSPGIARSLLRLVGTYIAILPLFAGFLPVLVDDRRRALQDYIAQTVVTHDDDRLVVVPESAVIWAAEAPTVTG